MNISKLIKLVLFVLSLFSLVQFSLSEEKLVLQHHIGYHHKYLVRKIEQEVFISRRINLERIMKGQELLADTARKTRRFCDRLNNDVMNKLRSEDAKSKLKFMYFPLKYLPDHYEANRRCQSMGMQLPELYTEQERIALNQILIDNNEEICHAGIEYIPEEASMRFISTGYPIWYGLHTEVLDKDKPVTFRYAIDDLDAKFFYTKSGKLVLKRSSPVQGTQHISHNYRGPTADFRSTWHEFKTQVAPLICQVKWTGIDEKYKTNVSEITGMYIEKTLARAKRNQDDMISYQDEICTLCDNLALLADESYISISSKLKNVLGKVDITVQSEPRNKRAVLGLAARMLFSAGPRFLWSLAGLVDRIRLRNKVKNFERRINDIDKDLKNVQNKQREDSKFVNELSTVVYNHTIQINQLELSNSALERRITDIEIKVNALQKAVAVLTSRVELVIRFNTLGIYLERLTSSLKDAVDTMEEIFHYALTEKTSPLILPPEQINEVQLQIMKNSDAILDPNFERMVSLIVPDPNIESELLVLISTHALSRNFVEIVELIPVPMYVNSKMLIPHLDYNLIALDAQKGAYQILTSNEVDNCINGHCYISDYQRQIPDLTCGATQIHNRNLEYCRFEEVTFQPIFFKPCNPDGILFSVEKSVSAQLFCSRDAAGTSSKIHVINQTGILKIPNGCTATVLTDKGSIILPGPPIATTVNLATSNLIITGPLYNLANDTYLNQSFPLIHQSVARYLQDNIAYFSTQVMKVDTRINEQNTRLLIALVISLVIVLTVIILLLLLYHMSTRFRSKIRFLKQEFSKMLSDVSKLKIVERMPPTAPPLSPPDHQSPSRFIVSKTFAPALPVKPNHLMKECPQHLLIKKGEYINFESKINIEDSEELYSKPSDPEKFDLVREGEISIRKFN